MNLIFRLAWRNIWRNRRRTLITLTSMVAAVVLSVVTRSMQKGSYDQMIENVVGSYTGHVQIQDPEFNDNRILDNTIAADSSLIGTIRGISGVKLVLPRLETFALAAGKKQSRGTLVVGIHPAAEERFNGLSGKIVDGDYLKPDDGGVLVAQKLAEYLDCGVGDSVVLLGQGYHGASAVALVPVRGIIHFASPDLDKRFIYMTTGKAQEIFSADGRVTSLVVEPVGKVNVEKFAATVKEKIGNGKYVVLTWKKLLPELVQQINGDNAGGLIMLGILYMVVAFGIFGTVLMMTNERLREFGVVNSLGLPAGKLAVMAAVEIIMIALIAAGAGTAFSLPVVLWFHAHPVQLTGEAAKAMINYGIEPVMPFLLNWKIFASQGCIILVLSCATSFFPFVVLRNFNPVEAMRK